VVIVNWKLPDDTLACVASLLADGVPPAHIHVVDNGSADGSAERLARELAEGVVLLHSAVNMGFAGGNNLAISAALDAGAQWVLLLNNDTVVRPGLFAALAAAQRLAPDVRLWSPLILFHDDPGTVWAVGDRWVAGTLATRSLWRNQPRPEDPPDVVRVNSLTACALLVHAEVFRAVGLLDERHFMYGEDSDFCLRAERAGFTLACAMRGEVLHKVSRSTGPQSPLQRTWRIGNMARLYRRHARGLQRPMMFAFSTLRTAKLALGDLLAGRLTLAAASWQGWLAGWFGAPDAPIAPPPVHDHPRPPDTTPF
jgi:GT2 family glycosyltransferase